MAEIRIIVGFLEERDIIVSVILAQSSLEVLSVPLDVIFFAKFTCSFSELIIITSDKND